MEVAGPQSPLPTPILLSEVLLQLSFSRQDTHCLDSRNPELTGQEPRAWLLSLSPYHGNMRKGLPVASSTGAPRLRTQLLTK